MSLRANIKPSATIAAIIVIVLLILAIYYRDDTNTAWIFGGIAIAVAAVCAVYVYTTHTAATADTSTGMYSNPTNSKPSSDESSDDESSDDDAAPVIPTNDKLSGDDAAPVALAKDIVPEQYVQKIHTALLASLLQPIATMGGGNFTLGETSLIKMNGDYEYPECSPVYSQQYPKHHVDTTRVKFNEVHNTTVENSRGEWEYNSDTGQLSIRDDIFGERAVDIIQECCDADNICNVVPALQAYITTQNIELSRDDMMACIASVNAHANFDGFCIEQGLIGDRMRSDTNTIFCLPSQLNGAEYPGYREEMIVAKLQAYNTDTTGGPAGQLAGDPGVAQFILDNAENTKTDLRGINNVRELLSAVNVAGAPKQLVLKNGYLLLSEHDEIATGGLIDVGEDICVAFGAHLHTMKLLIAHGVSMIGTNRPVGEPYNIGDIAYASAMPYNNYNNTNYNTHVHSRILAILVIYGQIKLLLQYAAREEKDVVLPPPGGGAFGNIWADIVLAILLASANQQRHGGYTPKITLLCFDLSERETYYNYYHTGAPMQSVATPPKDRDDRRPAVATKADRDTADARIDSTRAKLDAEIAFRNRMPDTIGDPPAHIFAINGNHLRAAGKLPNQTQLEMLFATPPVPTTHIRGGRGVVAIYCYLASRQNTAVPKMNCKYSNVVQIAADIDSLVLIYRDYTACMIVCALINGEFMPSIIIAPAEDIATTALHTYRGRNWPVDYMSDAQPTPASKYYTWLIRDNPQPDVDIDVHEGFSQAAILPAVRDADPKVNWINTDIHGSHLPHCVDIHTTEGNMMIYRDARMPDNQVFGAMGANYPFAIYDTDQHLLSTKLHPDRIITPTNDRQVCVDMCVRAQAALMDVMNNIPVMHAYSRLEQTPHELFAHQEAVVAAMWTMPAFVYAISTTPEHYAQLHHSNNTKNSFGELPYKNLNICDSNGNSYEVIALKVAHIGYMVAPLHSVMETSSETTRQRMAMHGDENAQTAVSVVLAKFDQTWTTVIAPTRAGLGQIQSMYDAWKLRPLDQYRLYTDDAHSGNTLRQPQYNAIAGIYEHNLGIIPACIGVNLGPRSAVWSKVCAGDYIAAESMSTEDIGHKFVIKPRYPKYVPHFAVCTERKGEWHADPSYVIRPM